MYKNNSRDSSKFKGFSPQLAAILIRTVVAHSPQFESEINFYSKRQKLGAILGKNAGFEKNISR